jgi:hypothetical protein
VEIESNLRNRIFFHGSQDKSDVRNIFRNGFHSEFIDRDGRWFRDGNLGIGVYLSCDWRTALWFGNILIQATVRESTRVLVSSVRPDPRVLEYLGREFGREVLEKDPRKVLPRNKHLTLEEFTAVFRLHYTEAWHSKRAESHPREFSKERSTHMALVHKLSRRLLHYGFNGFGNPEDDNGIVIMQAERVVPHRVVLDVPEEKHFDLTDPAVLAAASLPSLRKLFPAGAWEPKKSREG